MNTKKFQWILYLIAVTIITTISVQCYWNYKNYEENKLRITNEVQLSLDNAIEEYYAKLTKEEITTIVKFNNNKKIKFDSIFKHSKNLKKIKSLIKNDTSSVKSKFEITSISFSTDDDEDAKKTDSILKGFAKVFTKKQENKISNLKNTTTKNHTSIKYFSGQKSADSLKLIKNLKPIFLSVTSSSINYKQLDSLIKKQLVQKKLSVDFVFNHLKNDTIFYSTKDSLFSKSLTNNVSAKSTFLKKNEELSLQYNTPSLEALKRSSLGILLSFLLSLTVISSLFYLLKVINKQKNLATIKNDLISNITHEFKTPIATVSSAIEAIENFNVLKDTEKTKKYLAISSVQLKKLIQMVEKLLETATLDSEQLLLKKETTDIVDIIEKQVIKHKLLTNTKELIFSTNTKPIFINVDVFHFENVISNLIDNAIKYGGNSIEINVNSILNSTEITVSDNGNGIDKNQQQKIFDKFYRIPKGNTHNIKGFGIGLYYSKKIIEKHGGDISLYLKKGFTSFKISILNE